MLHNLAFVSLHVILHTLASTVTQRDIEQVALNSLPVITVLVKLKRPISTLFHALLSLLMSWNNSLCISFQITLFSIWICNRFVRCCTNVVTIIITCHVTLGIESKRSVFKNYSVHTVFTMPMTYIRHVFFLCLCCLTSSWNECCLTSVSTMLILFIQQPHVVMRGILLTCLFLVCSLTMSWWSLMSFNCSDNHRWTPYLPLGGTSGRTG